MKTYRFGDVVIASELPIGDLPPASASTVDWTVRVAPIDATRVLPPYHTWSDTDGQQVASFARLAERRVIEFGNTARFVVHAGNRTITCHAKADAPSAAVSQLLAHEVMPLVVGMQRLTLHASAVAMNGEAIAFAGSSGSGKSTLAVRLAQQGWSLLTDDVMIVDTRASHPRVVPIDMSVRLWPDSVSQLFALAMPGLERDGDSEAKRTLSASDTCVTYAYSATPLRALFLLDQTADESAVRVEPQAAVAAVLNHAFVLATDDALQAGQLFDQVSRTVGVARVYRLRSPASFDELDRVLAAACRAAAA